MLEVIFLGTGSGIPSRARNHSSILLRYEGDNMLWDCGEGTQRQMITGRYSFMKVDRIFITHWHADHWAGIIGLMQTMNLEKRKKPLYIYGPDAERFVGDILDMDYWGPRFRVIPKTVPYEGDEITTLVKTKMYEVSSTPVVHSVPAVAYCFEERGRWNVDIRKAGKFGLKQSPLVGKLKRDGSITLKGKKITLKQVGVYKKGVKAVYSGDTRPCKTLMNLAQDADLLIHDATFGKEDNELKDRPHTMVKDAAKTAKQANVKELVLTHFSRRYTDLKPLEKEAKSVFRNSRLAKDFMEIKLKATGSPSR